MELAFYMSVLPDWAGESVFLEKKKTRWEDEDELECNLKTCQVMLLLGFGQSIGAYVSGKFGEKWGKRATMHLNFVLSLIALVSCLLVTILSRVINNTVPLLINYWIFC